MSPDSPIPPLRADVEIVPVEHEGRQVFVLRDPEAEDDRAAALSGGGAAVVSLFDGRRTAAEVAAAFARQTGGGQASVPEILALAGRLEDDGLLDTPASRRARQEREEAFKRAATRPARFAGPGGYPNEPIALASHLAGFFRQEKGPGKPAPEAPSAPAARLLVAPHIDLHRGGPAYAWAYGALAGCAPPDVVVAFGVAHRSPDSPWVFTQKAYETPFGPIKVDMDVYRELARPLWYDERAHEGVHKAEHSLEFQAVWLRYLWRDAAPAWVPILCSTFERWAGAEPPTGVATVEGALKAMGEALARLSKSRRVLILAGVDLAHVGPRFGDPEDVTPELEKRIEAEDDDSLEKALALDADGFYRSVTRDGHWRKVCGLSALYTSLRLTRAMAPAARGELLTYGQAYDPAGGVVSFASALYR